MFTNIQEFTNWIESQKRFSPKLSLDKMRALCHILGDPHLKLKYIHIGGTNGKGSTVSFLKNILLEADLNVGSFISPYVLEFNERISYNDKYISDADLLYYGNLIISKYPEIEKENIEKPTFFEFLTLLSFLYFANIKDLDIVIMEVGLGGLLDSTNVITPLVSAITNVSFDHMNVLGNTKEEIALNKLGIAKDGVPLFTVYDEETKDIFTQEASKSNSPLYFVYPEKATNIMMNLEELSYDYSDFKDIKLHLLGYHQIQNSVLAIEIAKYLTKYYSITSSNIIEGLHKTLWPGRLEVLSKNPLIIIDGAHNIGGINSLASFIKTIKQDNYLKLIFAVSSDKDKIPMIDTLEKLVDEIVFTKFHYKRSDSASSLYALSHHQNKRVVEEVSEIIEEVLHEKDKIIIFCGSLYFISEVRSLIKKQI